VTTVNFTEDEPLPIGVGIAGRMQHAIDFTGAARPEDLARRRQHVRPHAAYAVRVPLPTT
jgi:hypothetical protein